MADIIRFFTIFLFLGGYAYAACTGSSPTWTTDGNEWADVEECITAASDGDTINVIAGDGSADWGTSETNLTTITKGVHIIGPGSGSLTITNLYEATDTRAGYNATFLMNYHPSSPSGSPSSIHFRLSGFTFDMDGKAAAFQAYNDETTPDYIRIDNNVFLDCPTRMTAIFGTVWGVMDNNVVTTNIGTETELCNTYGVDDEAWDDVGYAKGGPYHFYYEDNTYNVNDAVHYSGAGASFVSRFETVNMQSSGTTFVDLHGNMGSSGNYGVMGAEVYYNDINGVGSTSLELVDQRGGEVMCWGNDISNATAYASIREEVGDEYNVLSGSGIQHANDSYYWANTKDTSTYIEPSQTGNDCDGSVGTSTDPCDDVEEGYSLNEDDEWHGGDNSVQTSSSSPFDGTTEVGWGTLANRPSTCTTGVGYWATDQGSWNDEGADGLFYKCTSTDNWDLYYTPYDYPHPFRGELPGGGGASSAVGFYPILNGGKMGTVLNGGGLSVTVQ